MMTPSKAHLRLESFAGHWEGEERLFANDQNGEGGPAMGRSLARMALNDLALIVDYEREREGRVILRGHGIYTYDEDAGLYLMYWCDTNDGNARRYTGSFEGNSLVLTHQTSRHTSRLTHISDEPGRMRTLLETGKDNRFSPFYEGLYSGF